MLNQSLANVLLINNSEPKYVNNILNFIFETML